MKQPVELTIKGDVHVLKLNPGDRLIVSFSERALNRAQLGSVRQQLQNLYPLNEVLVLSGIDGLYVQPAGHDHLHRA